MKTRDPKILTKNKRKLAKRLRRKNDSDQAKPMFQPGNLHDEMAGRSRAVGFGGIGVVHTQVTGLGLGDAINENVPLLKTHMPYFESDHVLNLAYNVMTGGTCLDGRHRPVAGRRQLRRQSFSRSVACIHRARRRLGLDLGDYSIHFFRGIGWENAASHLSLDGSVPNAQQFL